MNHTGQSWITEFEFSGCTPAGCKKPSKIKESGYPPPKSAQQVFQKRQSDPTSIAAQRVRNPGGLNAQFVHNPSFVRTTQRRRIAPSETGSSGRLTGFKDRFTGAAQPFGQSEPGPESKAIAVARLLHEGSR